MLFENVYPRSEHALQTNKFSTNERLGFVIARNLKVHLNLRTRTLKKVFYKIKKNLKYNRKYWLGNLMNTYVLNDGKR